MKEATEKTANSVNQTLAKSSLGATIRRVLNDSETFQAWLYELRLKRHPPKGMFDKFNTKGVRDAKEDDTRRG